MTTIPNKIPNDVTNLIKDYTVGTTAEDIRQLQNQTFLNTKCPQYKKLQIYKKIPIKIDLPTPFQVVENIQIIQIVRAITETIKELITQNRIKYNLNIYYDRNTEYYNIKGIYISNMIIYELQNRGFCVHEELAYYPEELAHFPEELYGCFRNYKELLNNFEKYVDNNKININKLFIPLALVSSYNVFSDWCKYVIRINWSTLKCY